MVTRVLEDFVELSSGRTLAAKLTDILNAADYGASTSASAASNTTAINSAMDDAAAAGGSGFVIVNPGVSYTEADLTIATGVTLLIFSTSGTVTILNEYQGSTLPVTAGGLVIKSKGNTGILLRSLDYGVTADPILQVLDATNGDVAAIAPKYIELDELASAPAAPSANKVRLYAVDNGAGKTKLMALFSTGAAQQVAIEP